MEGIVAEMQKSRPLSNKGIRKMCTLLPMAIHLLIWPEELWRVLIIWRMCMSVPGCIDLPALTGCLNGERQGTVWLLGASVATATQYQLNLENSNKPHIEENSSFWQWGRQTKRNLSILPWQKKKNPSHCFIPIADSSLSCTSPTKTSMNSLDRKIICLSVCLPSKRAAIHTFQLLFIPTITRISPTQCAAIVLWIRAIVCANLQPPLSWSVITLVLCTHKFISALLLEH